MWSWIDLFQDLDTPGHSIASPRIAGELNEPYTIRRVKMVKLFMVKPFLYPMKWPKDSEANWAIRQFIAGIPRSEMPP